VYSTTPAGDHLIKALDDTETAGLRATVAAAWNIHELISQTEAAAFILLSSPAGLLADIGQGTQATADAFFAALASYRRTQGLPATSIAFGDSGIDADQGRVRRISRAGLAPLPAADCLALVDAAIAGTGAAVLAARLDQGVLRAQYGNVPAVLRDLAGVAAGSRSAERNGARQDVRTRLAALRAGERLNFLLETVCAHASGVLGHDSAEVIDPDRTFQDLGFESVTAVEFRNSLSSAVGLALPATLIFDYPTSRAAAAYIDRILDNPPAEDAAQSVLGQLGELEVRLASIAGDAGAEGCDQITAGLEALLRSWHDFRSDADHSLTTPNPTYESATDEELFDVLDSELGMY
jgi:acyl carrier protein